MAPGYAEGTKEVLMEKKNRRIPLDQMIYIADGPSDIPCFSVIKENGGKAQGNSPTESRSQQIFSVSSQEAFNRWPQIERLHL